MTYFLLTRPYENSQEMVPEIEKLGFNCLTSPLLDIKNINPLIDFKPYQSLIITSPKAIPFLPSDTDKTLWCVGELTAQKCKEKGLGYIIHRKDIEELLELILGHSPEEIGKTMYLRGKNISTNLKNMLSVMGYDVDEEICYDALPAENFTPEVIDLFQQNKIKTTALFSVQSAQNFVDIIQKNNLESFLKNLTCLAYSPQIKTTLLPLNFGNIIVCENPTMDCFWNELKNCVS